MSFFINSVHNSPLRTVLSMGLYVLACRGLCYAQNNNAEMYMDNPKIALQDAQASYNSGDYEKTISLVKVYVALTGEDYPGELFKNAQKCKAYNEEALLFEAKEDMLSASKCYLGILSINPNDTHAPTKLLELSKSGEANGHQYVDLGLSIKWATCNVGASSPNEYGDYFAWGEIVTKSEYGNSNYKWQKKDERYVYLTKYNYLKEDGKVDKKSRLEKSDDVASALWGDSWRMPIGEEILELQKNCVWTWSTIDGCNGYIATSRINGKSIFLPAAGCWDGGELKHKEVGGWFWTADLAEPQAAMTLRYYYDQRYLPSDNVFTQYACKRYYGFSVRPVTK